MMTDLYQITEETDIAILSIGEDSKKINFKHLTNMENVNFKPWVGPKYSEGLHGKKIMILGDSHYCKDELKEGGIISSDSSKISTIAFQTSSKLCSLI